MRTATRKILLIIAISALAYLPLITKFGYTFDDWYLMYAAKAYGAQVFHTIFSVDRPLRAYILIPEYFLFGENPLWYNLSAWAFRVLSALAFGWILRMTWPRRNIETFGMTILFILYPGFLSQFNGIDYQSQMVSLAAAMISIGLTLKAVSDIRTWKRWLWLTISILLGWLYLGLVDYEIGFEFLRVAVIFIFISRMQAGWSRQIKQTFLAWLPYTAIPVAFVFWRIFLFHTERKATDINTQLGAVLISPIGTLAQWALQIIQSTWTVFISAWWQPLYQMRENLQMWSIALALTITLGVIWFIQHLNAIDNKQTDDSRSLREALILGFVAAVVGLIPIILVNREVYFPYFSRYSLVSSAGVSVFLVALLSLTQKKWLVNAGLAILVCAALLTHYANAVNSARQTESMNQFWWQVAWRIPMIEQSTTLIASYPVVSILEDYFIWGPANLIYYPEKVNDAYVQTGIYAAIPSDATLLKVLSRERQEYDSRRNIITYTNYRNFVLLTQPGSTSCVQVIDGKQPELSSNEEPSFVQMAPFSELEHIQVNKDFRDPPSIVFGPEPPRDWCYYYEKASFARQTGDWQSVVGWGTQARSKNLTPSDQIEWMPFLQGYAVQGNIKTLTETARNVTDQGVRQQACTILPNTSGISAAMLEQIKILFCDAK